MKSCEKGDGCEDLDEDWEKILKDTGKGAGSKLNPPLSVIADLKQIF